ncbi:MAG: hypothetical protein LBG60_02480 [Bifidobacteriaceae bacterium]|nr:hypothetical protein [Bifidobacteriaceae bacterium]
MDNIKIAKAMEKYPIDARGSLAIPPAERPLYLDQVEVKHFFSRDVPSDHAEFLTQAANSSDLPTGMPVVVGLSADAIYFWSNYLDTVGGKLKQDPNKIAIKRFNLILDQRDDQRAYAAAIDYFHMARLGRYGFTV